MSMRQHFHQGVHVVQAPLQQDLPLELKGSNSGHPLLAVLVSPELTTLVEEWVLVVQLLGVQVE